MDNKLLDIYTDYLLSQNSYATATGLSDLLEGELSHDQITRFLNKEQLDSKHLWYYIKDKVRKHETEKGGVFIIDDTIEEKPHTNENDTVCWHYAHSKGRCIKGVGILTGMIRYDDLSLPLSFNTIRKDLIFSDIKTKKAKRKSKENKNQLFRNMLKQAILNNVKFEYVLGDNWFGSKNNMEYINNELEKKFIFGIKSNRLACTSTNREKKCQYQGIKSLDFQDNEAKVVYLKNLLFPLKLIKKVFKNGNGTIGVLYLVTNDLNLDVDCIYNIYQKRWRIEEYHKSIKQNASLSKSPTKTPISQKNHIFASIIAYCKLEILKEKKSQNHFSLKYKLILRANQIAYQELQEMKLSA